MPVRRQCKKIPSTEFLVGMCHSKTSPSAPLDANQWPFLLKATLETLRAGMEDTRSQARAGDLTREEAKFQAEALRDQFVLDLQSILTAEQFAQLQELRPDCEHRGGGRGPGRR